MYNVSGQFAAGTAKGGRMKRLTFRTDMGDDLLDAIAFINPDDAGGMYNLRDIGEYGSDELLLEIANRLAEYEDMEEQGLLVRLPCKLGDTVYRVIGNCTFPGDCGTKRMCKGCEYRILYIEEDVFYPGLLTDSGKLSSRYYTSREAAEKALEGNNESTV